MLIQNYAQFSYSFAKGEGSYLYDSTGKCYIDFGCGISVTNLGHCHPHILECLEKQANTLWHTSNLYPNDIVTSLAQRISNATFGGQVFFCNSGAEANEAAIKLALIYNNKVCGGQKPRIITMRDSFHGRTCATLSATGQDKVQKGFEPLVPFFTYINFNDLAAAEREFAKGDVCAVMLEFIQGESGVRSATKEFIAGVKNLTEKYGAIFIADEVQTGFGRTGKLFGYEHFGVTPDVITMAKAIANGLPMGGIVAKAKIAELFTPGTHGTTFGGNLLACAAAHGVLDILLEDGFLDDVTKKGDYLKLILEEKLGKHGAAVRGKGLMVGADMPIGNREFVNLALAEGLVTLLGGETAVRLYPPLNVSYDDMEKGVEIMEKVLKVK